MTDSIRHLPQLVQITPYEGGEEAIFAANGKQVSVARTDYGLFDVQTDTGRYLYTGMNANEASQATFQYLTGVNQ